MSGEFGKRVLDHLTVRRYNMLRSNCTILIVDDTEENIDILVESLADIYDIRIATSGKRALKIIETVKPDLFLLDVMMPEMDGYELCEILKADPKTKDIPVIFLTALSESRDEAKGLGLGAVDYIVKPFNIELVKARVHNHLQLRIHRTELERLVKERTMELEVTQDVTIKSMALLAEYRDNETGKHIKRTQKFTRLLANKLKDHPKFKHYLSQNAIDLLEKSAPLHDIGKVGVQDEVLLKPGLFTKEEFELMKKHTLYGGEIIERAQKELGEESFLNMAWEITMTHHEKWDGSGYPRGLSGEEIPISGRIIALADVYDALRSKRVYKPEMSHEASVEIILQGRGRHFDPDVVDAFMELNEKFHYISMKEADTYAELYEKESRSKVQ